MLCSLKSKPYLLVAAGLLGMSLYTFALRLPHPTLMGNDFATGMWYGACIGLEIVGLVLLRRGKSRCAQ